MADHDRNCFWNFHTNTYCTKIYFHEASVDNEVFVLSQNMIYVLRYTTRKTTFLSITQAIYNTRAEPIEL